jgi:hypothetical protein
MIVQVEEKLLMPDNFPAPRGAIQALKLLEFLLGKILEWAFHGVRYGPVQQTRAAFTVLDIRILLCLVLRGKVLGQVILYII